MIDNHDNIPVAAAGMSIAETLVGESVIVLTVAGEIDLLTTPSLRSAATTSLQTPGVEALIIDLSRVDFFGSAGLGALIDINTAVTDHGMVLRLVVDHHRPVVRPLTATGLDQHLVIYHSLSEALAADSDARAEPLK